MCVVALGGLLAAYRQGRVETQRLQTTFDQRLLRLAASYQQRLAEELQQRQVLLGAAHELLIERFFSEDSTPVPTTFQMRRDEDQAWRRFDRASAAFIHKDFEPNVKTLHYAYQSQSLWEQLVPLLSTSFRAVYFISETRMTRIWPSDIVTAHRADHDVTQEFFYSLVKPENNPSKEPRWTPIYYDFYSKVWMITLAFPVYDQQEFVGIMAADLDVTFLLKKLSNINVDGDDIKAFIFNDKGQLILHSDQQQLLPSDAGREYPLLNEFSETRQDITTYIQAVISGVIPSGSIQHQVFDGVLQHVSHHPLDKMTWYISLYYPDTVITTNLKKTLGDIYVNIILLTVCISLALYLSLNYFVVNRIRALANATALVSPESWEVKVSEQGNDEISFLGRRFNIMLSKINDLVRGLNENIAKLEVANLKSDRLITAIENSTSMVVILNKHWVLEYANACFWQTSGYSPSDNLSREEALLYRRGADNVPELRDIVAVLHDEHSNNAARQSDWRAEYLAQRKDSSTFWLMQSVSGVFSASGELEYFIAVGQYSTDLKQNQQKIEQLAYYDHLTGLHNRVLFKEQLRTALHVCQRDKTHFALMYLDLDHFKHINDTLGHEAGDKLLVEVANRIKECLREEDVIARLGGDEFSVLLHQVGSAQYAYVVANKIIAALNRPLSLMGQEVVIGASIGITMLPDDSLQLDSLMKNADLAMYKAKEKGRNTFQFYTADMNDQIEKRLAMERDLRRALKNQEFELYYQPVIDLQTNKIVAAEALLRWHHPDKGMVSPLDFIPIAEESGLIVPIGKWVLRNACLQAKNIQKALHFPLRIAVNVSARQLHDNGFVVAVASVLRDLRLAPEWLSVELTETTLMADGDKAIEQLRLIRALGVGIAIDDFGTGYSSLSYLKRLPVDTLKIDRTFVEGLPDNEEDCAIATLIGAMANSLKYKVIVEGVENAEQLEFLMRCGCGYAQGFLFSRPVPADQLLQLLFDSIYIDGSQ